MNPEQHLFQGRTEMQQKILYAAKDLFWKLGIRKVTVGDVADQADVSKMTFYRTFSNKQEVAFIVLENVLEDQVRQLERILNGQDPFSNKMKHLFELKKNNVQSISEALLQDLHALQDGQIGQLFSTNQTKVAELLRKHLKDAQKAKEIRPELDIDLVLHLIYDFQKKFNDPHFFSLFPSEKHLIIGATDFFLYGIAGRSS
jgi:AcrR family transcriptional regulator